MAFRTLIRRAYSTSIPLLSRAAASPRPYYRTNISTVQNKSLLRELSPKIGAPFMMFSSKPSSDESILQVLESEIECADQPDDKILQHKPASFPFEVEDNPGERTITLTREYGDEVIKVEVDIPTVEATEDSENEPEEGEEKDQDEEKNEGGDSSIPMVVSISKGNGPHLEFGITAFADEIVIDTFSIKHSEDADDRIAYEGPDFEDLDEKLQESLREYLEVRGINVKTAGFLHDYMTNKDMKEYLVWLKNLEKFIKK